MRDQGAFAVTAKNARIGEQRLEHGAPPRERHTTMFNTFYVVKSTTTLPLISPSRGLRHIVKFATYTIVCCRQHTMVEISLSGSGEGLG